MCCRPSPALSPCGGPRFRWCIGWTCPYSRPCPPSRPCSWGPSSGQTTDRHRASDLRSQRNVSHHTIVYVLEICYIQWWHPEDLFFHIFYILNDTLKVNKTYGLNEKCSTPGPEVLIIYQYLSYEVSLQWRVTWLVRWVESSFESSLYLLQHSLT